MFRHTNDTARGRYFLARGVARAMAAMVALMQSGASAEDVAAFIQRQQPATAMNLSWKVEDAAESGSFAEAVFNVLCDGPAPAPGPMPAGSLPADGALITFDVVPVASWASPGVVYRVEREGSYFYFRNERTDTGTHDKAWAVARSTWRHAA